jgi:hypothetical protein
MEFKVGDILVNRDGGRFEVIKARRDVPMFPYVVREMSGEYNGLWHIGANGEWLGTGSETPLLDVTLDVDYAISKMWEEYEV